ncbi:MAG: DUF4374 domain-containing protein [Cytophagales bacterium]|nr:DUF4374 domain-containing protein [Cytophagales bacterium]
MSKIKSILLRLLSVVLVASLISNCSDSDDAPAPNPVTEDPVITSYFLGIEAATDPAVDVLSVAESIESGSISPVNNGFEQPAWMSFIQGIDQIFVAGYTAAPEFTSYELVDGELTKGESFFTDQDIYALDVVDEGTMVLMGSAREGLSEKKIYKINTNTMTIETTVSVDFGNDVDNNLMAFPVDLKVRGSKLFAAYYMISAGGDFSTPSANEARVAVFSYPGLEFEKIIIDERAPNIGRYYTFNALEIDENGDIYTFSPSSLACGYAPAPATNSGILRIKNNETEFDPNYHIDFETLSGGYKINDMFYVGNGKAVVRVLKEDETNADFLWASYRPVAELPLLETGIIDLYNESFTLLPDVPKAGGGWNSATLVEEGKLYLGVSSSSFADIYIIDTENGTATKGATIKGNYAKAILSLSE